MKTKPFLLATAGSTVDGRTIDEKMLKEMASSYDPKTYGARLNIEHIRGISGDKPFRSYGDVEELSTAEVEVNFNGKTEKRLGLFGVFEINDDAKALNDAGQKVYPSIEIEENFGGKGFAYLMGCALTDSPASIATERMKFNRHLPGTICLSRDEAQLLEFAVTSSGDSGDGLVAKFGAMLDNFAAKFGGTSRTEEKPKSGPSEEQPAAFDFAQLKPLLTEFTTVISTDINALRTEMRSEVDQLGVKFAKLEKQEEDTASRDHVQRPRANGAAGEFARTDC